MSIFKKVMIAYDGSAASKRAAEKGMELAKDEGANVVGVKVIDFTGELIVPSDSLWKSIEKNMMDKAELMLDDLSAMAGKKDLHFTKNVREGSTESELIQCAKDEHADLVVMGATGKGSSGKHIGRSVDRVVKDAPCPVMVVS
ncbi:MAG: universal stress protein [Deltaproteobacteria bacterium]|nr:universal stress protein [Deltaproteobacteria bacterium]